VVVVLSALVMVSTFQASLLVMPLLIMMCAGEVMLLLILMLSV
jgi:hypothetical protein